MFKVSLLILVISILSFAFYPTILSTLRDNDEIIGYLGRIHAPQNSPTTRILNIFGPLIKLILTYASPADQFGIYELKGINDKVEIITDKFGIPHIYGHTANDVYFGQGYAHAHDRLWQITFDDYLCQGRLSELFGEVAVPTDTIMRLFGFNRKAQTFDVNTLTKEEKEHSLSYLNGLNAYINNPKTTKPVEFKILGLPLQNITRENLICRNFLLSWKMSQGWNAEITRLMLINQLGLNSDEYRELKDVYPSDNPTIIENPGEWNSIIKKMGNNTLFFKSMNPFLQQMGGSNSWVVHGKYTDSGNAMLCNDPHLPLTAPSMWYINHLVSSDGAFQATGVSAAGLPGVTIGHNGFAAWGCTLSVVDISDLFIEKINPNNESQYEFEGKWEDLKIIEETFFVKSLNKNITKKLRFTRNGPIISNEIGLNITASFRSLLADQRFYIEHLQLMSVRSFEDFCKILNQSPIPLNVVYADSDGNIGYKASGSCPIRARGHGGDVAVPGWTKEYDWLGLVPPSEMPHGLNPEKGFYVTANNKLINSDYKYFLGNQWNTGFRANRITQIIKNQIESGEKFTLDDMRKIQLDITSLGAKKFVNILKTSAQDVSNELPDVISKHVWKTLIEFDGVMDPNNYAPTIYKLSRLFLSHHLLLGALNETLFEQWLGYGTHPMIGNPNQISDYDHIAMVEMLKNSSSVWVTRAGGKVKVLTKMISSTTSWLIREFGSQVEYNSDFSIKNIKGWEWGNLHTATARHVLGANPVLAQALNVGPFPIGGDSDTPKNTPGDLLHPKQTTKWYTHYRQCFDMGKLNEARVIQFPGQSGHLGKHYDDYSEDWMKGNTIPLSWNREDIITERVLVLVPDHHRHEN